MNNGLALVELAAILYGRSVFDRGCFPKAEALERLMRGARRARRVRDVTPTVSANFLPIFYRPAKSGHRWASSKMR
jgi:hypothetical protein